LKDLGYDHVGIDQLVQLKNHGVSADYIRDVRAKGYKDLTIDQLIEMRMHGIPKKGIV
jgi:hypothetical protein